VEKNWKRWEKEKHWDRRGDQDHGRHNERDRGGHGNQSRKD
jgi:hypothetical protein